MRMLGLDLGNKTLGIAMSDDLGILVSPYNNFFFTSRDFLTAAKEVVRVCIEFGIKEIALGNPIQLNGEESTRSRITKKFMKMILKLDSSLTIILIDERFTTIEATKILNTCGNKERNGRIVDTVAAVLILESYIGRKKRQ